MTAQHEDATETILEGKRPWYFTNITIILLFLCVYPFVLPLVWSNPYYSSSRKVLLTFIILVASAALIKSWLLLAI